MSTGSSVHWPFRDILHRTTSGKNRPVLRLCKEGTPTSQARPHHRILTSLGRWRLLSSGQCQELDENGPGLYKMIFLRCGSVTTTQENLLVRRVLANLPLAAPAGSSGTYSFTSVSNHFTDHFQVLQVPLAKAEAPRAVVESTTMAAQAVHPTPAIHYPAFCQAENGGSSRQVKQFEIQRCRAQMEAKPAQLSGLLKLYERESTIRNWVLRRCCGHISNGSMVPWLRRWMHARRTRITREHKEQRRNDE
jgi:hypothetical protein